MISPSPPPHPHDEAVRALPRYRRRTVTIAALAALVTGCGGAPAPPPPPPVRPTPTATPPTDRWVRIDTPQFAITYDRQEPGIAIRARPQAGERGGAAARFDPADPVGLILCREALQTAAGSVEATAGADRATPQITSEVAGDLARLTIEDIALGTVATALWDLRVRAGEITITRTITLRQAATDTVAAMILQAAVRDDSAHLLLLEGTAHRATADLTARREGLRGATVGLIDRDPRGVLLTARSNEATGAEVGIVGDRAILTLRNNLAAARGSSLRTTTTLRFGPATHLQGPTSSFDPALDARFLSAGYFGNIVESRCCGPLLRASMASYSDTCWVRDLAYATRGYRHVLDDLGPLRNTMQAFLDRVDGAGTVPEFITGGGEAVRRGAWDSQPDLIHAVYAYVAQTGDVAFFTRNRAACGRIVAWLRASDGDSDGIPDRTDMPYGYYDTVTNGVRHTYAIASFYAAYGELAELAEAVNDGEAARYRDDAARLREAFDRPVAAGGFWLPTQPYPVAWFTAEGQPIAGCETFGILAALQSDLIPAGPRRDTLARYLREHLGEFVNGAPYGVRLMIGGYAPELRREVTPPVPPWMLDASAPWIAGLDVPVRARLGQREEAATVLAHYLRAYDVAALPLPEFAAAPDARYGAGQSDDFGRSWDNAAWFSIVYEGHYGLRPTPAALYIQPAPVRQIAGDTVVGYRYGKARIALGLAGRRYTVQVDQPCALVLLPLDADTQVRLDGGAAAASVALQARPGRTYTIESSGGEAR